MAEAASALTAGLRWAIMGASWIGATMKTVTPTTVLDYYDGIQIFAAQDATGGHYIGTMVGTEGGYWRYLITGVSPADLHLFRCGEMDLRALLLASPTDERFITVATGKFSDPLRLTAVEEPLEQTAFLPEEGFFLEEEAIEDTPVSEAEAGNQTATPPAPWAGDKVPLSEIARDLQAQISQSLYVDTDQQGQHYIATPFAFDDGDEPVVALIEDGSNQALLSDLGNTFFRMSYESRPDPGEVSRILADAGISQHNGELTKPLRQGQYAEAVLGFVHALLKIDKMSTSHKSPAYDPPAAPGNSHCRGDLKL